MCSPLCFSFGFRVYIVEVFVCRKKMFSFLSDFSRVVMTLVMLAREKNYFLFFDVDSDVWSWRNEKDWFLLEVDLFFFSLFFMVFF